MTYWDTSYPASILRVNWTMPPPTISGLGVTFHVPADVKADSYEMNWGDGTVDYWGPTTGDASHTYDSAGTYQVVMDPYSARFPSHSESVTVTTPP